MGEVARTGGKRMYAGLLRAGGNGAISGSETLWGSSAAFEAVGTEI